MADGDREGVDALEDEELWPRAAQVRDRVEELRGEERRDGMVRMRRRRRGEEGKGERRRVREKGGSAVMRRRSVVEVARASGERAHGVVRSR